MIKQPVILIATLLLTLVSAGVAAQNIMFLHRGPIASLSDADKALVSATMKEALDAGKDGDTLEWSSPDSGARGSISLLDTHEDYGTTCRTIRTSTTADGREGGGTYRLCLAEDKTWRFAPLRRKSG